MAWKKGALGGAREAPGENGALKKARFFLNEPIKSGSRSDPAELLAAAHAISFSLALSNELRLRISEAGEFLTTATVTVEHLPVGWTIMHIHLDVLASLRRVTQGRFIDATVRAKTNCLISRLLRANISMTAKLNKMILIVPKTRRNGSGSRNRVKTPS